MNYIWLVPGPKGLTLANYTYTYDKSGSATSYQDAASSLTYRYDKTGQLLSASGTLNGSNYSGSWSYDANGNRTMSGYVIGTGNELLNDGTYTYTYDRNGNTLTKTNTATGDQWQYHWDYHNQLVEAVEKTKDGVVENDEKFTYDIKGRLIGVVINGVQQRWTVFDGANVYLDFNGAGTAVMERYLTNPAAYGALYARVSADGAVNWYITDRLGSVRQIVDTSGNVLDTIVYDPWGNIVSESNASNGDRFQYAGGQYDALQQMYLFTARWENPQDGRWESPDPLGLGPDSNIYRYVRNATPNYVDTSGLQMQVLLPGGITVKGLPSPLDGKTHYTLPWDQVAGAKRRIKYVVDLTGINGDITIVGTNNWNCICARVGIGPLAKDYAEAMKAVNTIIKEIKGDFPTVFLPVGSKGQKLNWRKDKTVKLEYDITPKNMKGACGTIIKITIKAHLKSTRYTTIKE